MDNEKFGNFIKELRKEKGLTQKEMGDKLNITDKAISKWERGLSFPDISMLNSLADFFEIDISELLNCERGAKQEVDVEALIKEAIEKYKNIEEKRKEKIKRIKKITGIISIILFIIFSIIQGIYFIILKKHNFEYVIDILLYIINEIIILSALISVNFLFTKIKNKKIITYILFLFFTIINLAFMINNGFTNKCIVSFSKDFSNELVLKINRDTGSIKLYRNAKLFIFAKEKEQFSYECEGKIKKQWFTNDICGITYKDKNGNIREYVATYGDRGNSISYYYVTSAISGYWQVSTQYGQPTRCLADSKGITITKNGEKELFEYSNCKQFGTIALVLYKNDIPKYVIALDENCEIDEQTNIIKKDGTIILSEISMEKTISESLYCMTYKNENNLSNYNVVNVGKYDYKIQNGIMYISFDGINTIEVPGDFSEMTNTSYNDYNYLISEEKTIFYYLKNGKRYLVYSDDKGENWNTVEIENKSSIENINFVNSKVGYILKFEDVAMGVAFGKISKTIDGGASWNDIYFGVGDKEKTFKTSSKIKFIDENIGFLTMPMTGGESCEIYMTKDGGNNFTKLEILESDIYDYYNIPTLENNKLYIKITQGTDGDYSGENYNKIYYSEDKGNTWNLV